MLILVLALAVGPVPGAVPAPTAASQPAPLDRAEAYYLFSRGLQARLQGDPDGALADLKQAQRLDPGASAIRVEAARLLREVGRVEDAIREAEAAVALDREDADAHSTLAQLLQVQAAGAEAGLRRAKDEYEQVIRLRSTDRQALLSLAGIYVELGEHAAAARTWELYLALDPGNFEVHIQRGTQLLLAGKTEEAAAALKAALELQPRSARAYEALAEIYKNAEQADQAVLHYRKALEIEPRNLRVRLELGDVLAQAKRAQEALDEANAVLAEDAANPFALDLKGRSLRDLRRFDEAEAAADVTLAAVPDDLRAAYLKVTIAEARRDFPRAIALIEAFLARARPKEGEAAGSERLFLLHLGFAQQQLGRHADAAAAFARAKAAGDPPDASVLGFHAEALYLAKQKDAAFEAVRAARERFPDDVDLTGLEATLRRERGDEAGARTLIERLQRQTPQDPKVLVRVADYYRRAKQLPQAEAALAAARTADPKSPSVLFQLGAVLERQKRHDEADAVFRQALAIEPDSAPVLNYLGYMNSERGVKLEESLTLVQRAVELDPSSGAYKDSLGWALYRLDRLEAAENAVRQALESDGDNAVILDHLGDILSKRGRVAEALQSWQRALAGEDDEGELDRERVTAKVRDAQRVLHAQQQGASAPRP